MLINRGAIQADSAIGARISGDKWQTARYLQDAGLPGPTHYRVDSINSSQKVANQLGWPLVVKPVDRDRGEGVTVNINDINHLNDSIQNVKDDSCSHNYKDFICRNIRTAKGEYWFFANHAREI